MFLSDFSIRRPVATVVIIIALMCLGLLALKKLRVNQIPDVEQPVLVVTIPYPGASPDTVEREIINRVEKSLQSIPRVDQIRSTASREPARRSSSIFNFKKNMVEAADEIRNAIASVRHKLPIEMREPILQRVDPAAQPIMQLALSSTTQTPRRDLAPGRGRCWPTASAASTAWPIVNVNGALRRELSVLLRAEKLREYNVSVTDVVNALRTQNTTAPVGRVQGALDEQSIRLVGRIESPARVRADRRQAPRQRDRAPGPGGRRSQDGFAELAGFSLRNGKPERRHLDHALARCQHRHRWPTTCATLVDEINKTLPAGTKLEVTQDGGEDAQNSLKNVIEALIFGAGADDLRGLRVPQFVALDADHGAVAADLGDRRVHRRVAVRLHAELHDAAGAVAGDRRADRRRDRGAREHRAPHGARRGPHARRRANGTAEIGLAVTATTFSIIAVFIPVAFMAASRASGSARSR